MICFVIERGGFIKIFKTRRVRVPLLKVKRGINNHWLLVSVVVVCSVIYILSVCDVDKQRGRRTIAFGVD